MKPVTLCPDPVPVIRICVGEPALGLAPGRIGTGTATAAGAARTAIAAPAIIDRTIRVRKRGTMRDTNLKLGQWPFLIIMVTRLVLVANNLVGRLLPGRSLSWPPSHMVRAVRSRSCSGSLLSDLDCHMQ